MRVLNETLDPWSAILHMVMRYKELPFEITHTPIDIPPEFRDRYLVLRDPYVTLEYLEDRHPEPSIFPEDLAKKAHTRCIVRYLKDNTVQRNLEWFLDQCDAAGHPRNALAALQPGKRLHILDFYIAAYGTHLEPFKSWQQIQTNYWMPPNLNQNEKTIPFAGCTTNRNVTAGGYAYFTTGK